MKNLQRESKNRTRSERLIDQLLTKEDIQSEPLKKVKLDENKASVSRLSSSEAFEKIKKCLKQKEKIAKTIPVLRNLLKKYFGRITSEEAIFCAKEVLLSDFSSFFPVDQLLDFIQDIQNFYQDLEESDTIFLENAKFISETFNQLFTDDSLKFHSLLKTLNEKIDQLEKGSQLTHLVSEGFLLFRQILKKPWARAAVLQVLQKVYRKREIFTTETIEEVVKMIDLQFGGSTAGDVKSINEAGHQVVDSRDVVWSVSSLDSWACKQSGFNESSRKS
jgi:NADH:ubiquinone oxidoreductase subunit E